LGIKKPLGAILKDLKYCSDEDIQKALEIQKEFGGRIGTIFVNTGILKEENIIEALSWQFGYPVLKEIEIKSLKLENVNMEFFKEHQILPISLKDKQLSIAISDPLKIVKLAFLKQLGYSIDIFLATTELVREKIDELFETTSSSELGVFEVEIEKLRELASEAPVIKLLNSIFLEAVEKKTSDIHFETFEKNIIVRYRIDGRMIIAKTIPLQFKMATIARLKLLSKMNITENRLPQDGRINIKVLNKEIDIRASSLPTRFGESFVLRLLDKTSMSYNIDDLGISHKQLETIKKVISKSHGIFLTTGPTGSGKTTTLYSALNYLKDDETKIITVEDPVEYENEGISQVQVNSEIGLKFSSVLRSVLRQDPDIIMVGEIRDEETARIAIQASLTGHLVLSTLHTNTALGAIRRLLDMGIELFLLQSSLVGVMSQRLVRRLCSKCKEKVELDEDTIKEYQIETIIKQHNMAPNYYKAKGCEQCSFTGYKGRISIVEIVEWNKKVSEIFNKNIDFDDIHKIGGISLFDNGIMKVIEGVTTLEEIHKVTHEE